jgi:hypothetical protein
MIPEGGASGLCLLQKPLYKFSYINRPTCTHMKGTVRCPNIAIPHFYSFGLQPIGMIRMLLRRLLEKNSLFSIDSGP